MFNLFKKKLDIKGIAQSSKIEPVFENGQITSFLIFIDDNVNKTFSKNKDDLNLFVSIIEFRINKRDFADARLTVLDPLLVDVDAIINESELKTANRGIFTQNQKIVAKWNAFD